MFQQNILGLHLLLVQVQGMSLPPWLRKKGEGQSEEAGEENASMPFFPHFALRDLFGWTVALGVLAALAALFPAELGEKADPFAAAYAGIRPEWDFMFMFETLKLVPGGEILGVEYEAIPILLFGLAGLALVLVPFLERGERSSRAFGVVVLVYAVGMTAWGYRSLVPVAMVIGTAVLVGLLALGTARGGSES